jgi:c-di-GMP phosphodiesterase
LSVLLMSAADGRQASRALQEQALARGRWLELLAEAAGETPPQALFSVGLLSMLEVLLQLPLATALAPLKLSEPARQALLQRAGPWADYLALAAALDAADDAALERLSGRWGGVAAVQAMAERSWTWAAEVAGPALADARKRR